MTTIIKNSEGKILRNSAGRILKQNYNFGNGFNNGALNLRVELLNICNQVPSDNWTVTWFANKVPAANTNEVSLYMICGGASSGERISTQNNFSVIGLPTTQHRGYVRIANGVVSSAYCHTTSAIVGKSITAFAIGYGGNNGSTVLGSYRMGPVVCGWLRIYNRALSAVELTYERNNNLGNEPLSDLGLICDLRMNQAEILDFSLLQNGSSMRVGVRNYATTEGKHAEILGLPAGTLQEKLTYANNNLFVSFI